MKCWYPLSTIEGIRIIMILAIELSPKCQMQRLDLLFSGIIKILKICRTYNLKFSLRKNYKYSNSSISLMHYLENIEYCNLFIPIILWKDLLSWRINFICFAQLISGYLCMKHIALVYSYYNSLNNGKPTFWYYGTAYHY